MPALPPSRPHAPAHRRRRSPCRSVRFWLLPVLMVALLAAAGTGLYMGGLANPTAHLKDFPVAVVNQDAGAQVPGEDGATVQQNLGRQIVDGFVEEAAEGGELDLRVLSWDEAQRQLGTGKIYAAAVVPETFSADAVGLVSGSLTQEQTARPTVTVYTDPQAGALGTRLATGAIEPGLEQAGTTLGAQLTAAAQDAEDRARAQVEQQLADSQAQQVRRMQQAAAQAGPAAQVFAQQLAQQQDTPARLADQLAPRISAASAVLLADPVQVTTTAYHDLEEGTALGMGAFYYAILLLVLGLTGSIGINVLVDGRLGIAPLELGPRFRQGLATTPSRPVTFLLKWGLFVVAAAPAAGVVMWVAHAAGVPLPHGQVLLLTSWLAMAAVSAVVFALLTLFGSAGMLLAMLYLVLMGLPSAGAVVPLEALPAFFRAIAPAEPLHHIAMAVRSVLYFDAAPGAGLRTGALALTAILAAAVLVALAVGTAYDRTTGRRGAAAQRVGPAV
ncbi:ABC transporter permease [Kocuria sp. U4B]